MPLMHAALTDPEYGFDVVDETGHVMRIDVPVEQGGGGTGFRPMQTVRRFVGCSGVDVVSILNKQKQQLKGLEIKVDGEREKGKEPSLWESLHIRFEITGVVEPGKAWRAVDLSVNKYCSVAETLRRAGAVITWSVLVNGVEVNTNNP